MLLHEKEMQLKAKEQSAVILLHHREGWKQRGAEAKLVLCLVLTLKQPSMALRTPAEFRKALFPLDTGSWLPASKATGSINAFTSAPVPGKDVSYFCKSNRKSPRGKRKNLTYTLQLSVETRGNMFKTLFFLWVADCNDPGLEIQRHQVVDAKF